MNCGTSQHRRQHKPSVDSYGLILWSSQMACQLHDKTKSLSQGKWKLLEKLSWPSPLQESPLQMMVAQACHDMGWSPWPVSGESSPCASSHCTVCSLQPRFPIPSEYLWILLTYNDFLSFHSPRVNCAQYNLSSYPALCCRLAIVSLRHVPTQWVCESGGCSILHTYLQTCLRLPFQNQRLPSQNRELCLKCSFIHESRTHWFAFILGHSWLAAITIGYLKNSRKVNWRQSVPYLCDPSCFDEGKEGEQKGTTCRDWRKEGLKSFRYVQG